jgi:hypothetical protein
MNEQRKETNPAGWLPVSAGRTERREQTPEELRSALEHALRTHGRAAVIVLEVSSNYAKRARERVYAVLEKWQRGRSEHLHLASTGTNRFALVVAPLAFPGHARALAEHLSRSLDPRVCPLLRRALPYAWCGLAVYPEDGIDAESLITHADAAIERMRVGGARRLAVELSRRRHVRANCFRPLGLPGSESA